MQAISSNFQAAIASGYELVLYADVLAPPHNGAKGSVLLPNIPLSAGSVTVSRSNTTRRTFSLTATLTDSTLIPESNSDAAAPFGNEIELYAGWIEPGARSPFVIPATGLVEKIPLGVFAFTTNSMMDSGSDLTMVLSGFDRSWSVSQRAFTQAYLVGTTIVSPEDAIQGILTAQFPDLPSLSCSPPSGFQMSSDVSFAPGADPWASCLNIAAATGYELYFDMNGIPTMHPIPQPTPSSPANYSFATDGSGDLVPATVNRILTREGVSNDFTMQATGSKHTPAGGGSTVYKGQEVDNNTDSPTWVGGTFGDIPTFESSSIPNSISACMSAAQMDLQASLGKIETYIVTTPPAPMFDIDDLISLTSTRLKASSVLTVVDQVTFSLSHTNKTTFNLRRVYAYQG